MAKDWTKTKAYRELKAGLADNLAARELVEPVYQDMLNRYLELWCEFQQLGEDIRGRAGAAGVPGGKCALILENGRIRARGVTVSR